MLLAEEIEVSPEVITAKVSPDNDLSGVMGGNWDLERRISLATAAKHQAIREHFLDGKPWQETDLFRINYADRLREGPVKNRVTMQDLVALYDTRLDKLYRSMAQHGFDRRLGPLPNVVIGREGEVMLTNQGNHHIAIAQILGIATVPCRVQCVHLAWLERSDEHA